MRVVLDTNVVASALLWGGVPEQLIRLAGEARLELITSMPLLEELAGVLERPKFARRLALKGLSAADIVAQYRALSDTVEAAPVEEKTLRDPDDAAVLACALAGKVEAIVSGDDDLLSLGNYAGIRIISPAECLRATR